LFTQYELIVGTEYWQDVARRFKKPACVGRMANCFSFFELNVHAPFYSKINEALGLANESFYTDYINHPVLLDRITSLESFAKPGTDDATFLLMLALAEGAILYSNFAYLKHFQSQGKNKILNIVRGINFSARDEGLHSDASAWLFRTLLEEKGQSIEDYARTAMAMAEYVRQHEHQIVDMIFERGEIPGITATQLKNFVDSRIDIVLKNCGFKSVYNHKHNPIADWFYQGVNSFMSNDFFSGKGREYERSWDEGELSW
jgi:ribonucleotide reductase beta subunit family protein with ferritin-like domain